MKKLIIIICFFTIQSSFAETFSVDLVKVAGFIKKSALIRPNYSHDRLRINEIGNMKLIVDEGFFFFADKYYIQFSIMLSNRLAYNNVQCTLEINNDRLIIKNCGGDSIDFDWPNRRTRLQIPLAYVLHTS